MVIDSFQERFNEYAALTMFFQSQAFPTEKSQKKPDWLFVDFQKNQRRSKKPEFQNMASKKTN